MSETDDNDEEPGYSNKKERRVILATAVVSLLTIGVVLFAISPQWYQNYGPVQPIPFSHKIHAGQYKIPCLYCHHSAEYTYHAEVPGLETCMNCHSLVKTDSPYIKQITEAYKANRPIQWVKVHVLPDFVHFNHRRHIAAGVQCQTCHGPVEEMSRVYQWAGLNMGWCINCHRDDNYLTDYRIKWSQKEKEMKGEVGKQQPMLDEMLSHKNPHNANISCSTCHY